MNLNEEITVMEEEEEPEWEEPEWEKPNGSRWIVAITDKRKIIILSVPGIHYSFTDEGIDAEMIFGDDEAPDQEPGIYEWICNLDLSTDWETGYVDDMSFYPIEINKLYSWEDGKVNESGNQETQSDS